MIELQPGGVVFVRAFLAVTAAMLVLFVGKTINQRFAPLREFNIPEPVTGGLLFAVVFWVLHGATGIRITFDLVARDVLLIYFFTTIGLNTRLGDLKAGGRPLLLLLACVSAFLFLQDGLGVAVATLIGLPAPVGLLAGSVSMLGGPGTAIAWAPAFADQPGLANALEIGIICATAGLVLASIAGGPVAQFLVKRYGLSGQGAGQPEVGIQYGTAEPTIDYFSMLHALLAIHISAIVGIFAHHLITRAGINVPAFLPCLMTAILLANLMPYAARTVSWPFRTPALALMAEISLGVFLAMSLMSMQLSTLIGLGGPLFVLIGAQLVLIVFFAVFVTFPALGRSYDAAVISAGFIGFGLGATPTAMANMTAITQRYGASHVAFLVVPLVGAFFIDVLNATVIPIFLAML